MKKTDLNKPATRGELLATNKELKAVAAKIDLLAATTKKDLRRFATKKDLQKFATKEDLKKFATKDDLLALVSKAEFNYRLDDIERRMITREDWDKHMTLLDKVAAQIEENRHERLLFQRQYSRHDDQLHDHEKRIGVLEKAA